MNPSQQKKLDKAFKITSVCRADIVMQELMTEAEALKLTDDQMEEIASQISEGIMPNFWEALEVCVQYIKDHCQVCHQRQDDDGRCGCTNQNQK